MQPRTFRIGIWCNNKAWGGLEINSYRFAVWLRAAGHEVFCYGPAESKFAQACLEARLPFGEVRKGRKYGDIKAIKQLGGHLKRDKPQVLVVPISKDISTAALARSLYSRRTKLVHQQHMIFGLSKRDALHTFFYKRLAAWVAPLPYIAQRSLAHTRFPKERMHVIPLGIDTAPFVAAGKDKVGARAALGLAGEKLLVGIIGRLDPQKGQSLLLQAMAQLSKQAEVPPFEAVFIGAETVERAEGYQAVLQHEAEELGLCTRVHFRPFMAQPAQGFAALDVFVLGSKYETYGMTTLEAMAAGTPIVASGAGGTLELLEGGKWGALFEPQDAEALAEALGKTLKELGAAKALAQQAQQHAVQHYHYQTQIAAYEQLFTALF